MIRRRFSGSLPPRWAVARSANRMSSSPPWPCGPSSQSWRGVRGGVVDAKIALMNRALEVKKTEVSEEIKIRDPAKLSSFLQEEERTLKGYVDAVKKTGANVVLFQKGIDDLVQHYLAKEGIYAVRRAKESDMEKLV